MTNGLPTQSLLASEPRDGEGAGPKPHEAPGEETREVSHQVGGGFQPDGIKRFSEETTRDSS